MGTLVGGEDGTRHPVIGTKSSERKSHRSRGCCPHLGGWPLWDASWPLRRCFDSTLNRCFWASNSQWVGPWLAADLNFNLKIKKDRSVLLLLWWLAQLAGARGQEAKVTSLSHVWALPRLAVTECSWVSKQLFRVVPRGPESTRPSQKTLPRGEAAECHM